MNTQAISDHARIDLDQATNSATEGGTRRWWRFFSLRDRSARPRRMSRRDMLEEMRSEHLRLIETLERIDRRLDSPTAHAGNPSMEIDPMPVIEGIRDISRGQKEISTTLGTLNEWVERAEKTDRTLTSAVKNVDQTLGEVRSTQGQTRTALERISTQLENAGTRFETLFERMQEAEEAMTRDYRKLQQRTIISMAGIAASVVVVLGLFMTAPWA